MKDPNKAGEIRAFLDRMCQEVKSPRFNKTDRELYDHTLFTEGHINFAYTFGFISFGEYEYYMDILRVARYDIPKSVKGY